MFSPTGRAMVMKFGLVSLELISILSAAIAFRAEDSRLNLVTPPIINRRWTRFSIWTRFPPSVRPNSGTVLSLLLSVYHPRGWGTFAGLGTGALAALGAAEEVIFRAYFFRLLSMATGTWIAVLVTSALFGAVHAANPGANLFSSLAIALEAGHFGRSLRGHGTALDADRIACRMELCRGCSVWNVGLRWTGERGAQPW